MLALQPFLRLEDLPAGSGIVGDPGVTADPAGAGGADGSGASRAGAVGAGGTALAHATRQQPRTANAPW